MSGSDLQRLTELFLSQVGTREQGENNVIYNTDFYGGPVGGPDFPWCCAFIWDVFRMAGLSALFCGGQKTAYCPFVASWAQSHDRWVTQDYRPGDVILYDFDGDRIADHIGFCVAVSGTSLTVVEGNVASEVRRMTRSAVGVMGALRPTYAEAPETPVDSQPSGSRTYIVQSHDSLWKIAREQLGDENRWPEIFDLNGLASTMIHPGDVLILPETLPYPPQHPESDLPFALPSVCVELPQLQPGTRGRDVQALQLLLLRDGCELPQYGADGDFGAETEKALKQWQTAKGLKPTGKADALTWFSLIC